jgi:hypothetical protein
MKYVVINLNGVMEIREDSYSIPERGLVIDDAQQEQLTTGQFIFQNGQIVVNPNPPRKIT